MGINFSVGKYPKEECPDVLYRVGVQIPMQDCKFLHVVIMIWATLFNTHTHTYRFLSGCEEVENRTSQLVEPHNFLQPRNTTLLHEFYIAATHILEYTHTQCLPTHLPHGLVR